MKHPFKVFISFDFEGLGGVASWSETNGNQRFNDLATRQIGAFCNGILAAESQAEIWIADSHSMGKNLLWEKLPEQVQLIRGFPRKHYMMEGLDTSFSRLALFGYHTAIGGGGMMDHTYSASSIYRISLNDEPLDEGVINALFAGEFDVPLGFVYGDDQTTAYYQRHYPEVDTLVSKHAISRFAGRMFSEEKLLKQLHEKGKRLVQHPGTVFKMTPPYQCTIEFTDSTRAYLTSIVPGVTQTESRVIEFQPQNFIEFYEVLMTILYVSYSAKLIS